MHAILSSWKQPYSLALYTYMHVDVVYRIHRCKSALHTNHVTVRNGARRYGLTENMTKMQQLPTKNHQNLRIMDNGKKVKSKRTIETGSPELELNFWLSTSQYYNTNSTTYVYRIHSVHFHMTYLSIWIIYHFRIDNKYLAVSTI